MAVNFQRELEKIIEGLEAAKNRDGAVFENKNVIIGNGNAVFGYENAAAGNGNVVSSYVAPSLLLHSCCAPCSSYVLEYLRKYFRITVYYYNPNITEEDEYLFRKKEQLRLIDELNRSMNETKELYYSDVHSDDAVRVTEMSGNMHPENDMDICYSISVLDADYDPAQFFEAARGFEGSPEGGERCERCFELRLSATASEAAEKGFDYFCTTLSISPLKNALLLNEIGSRLGERYGVPFLPSDFKKKEGYKKSIELSKEHNLYRQDYCGCIFSKAERNRE